VNRTAAAVALVLVAAAGVATWCWLDREPAPVVPAKPTAAPVAPPSAGAPAQADLTKPQAPPKAAVAAVPRLQFPDGSSMPALNGVKTDVVIEWGKRPFTPVVGTENGPGGGKWYVHQNGARSTTAMVDMNGVPQPTGIVAEPEKSLPTLPDQGPPPGTGAPKK
jgi:hypothetical protein